MPSGSEQGSPGALRLSPPTPDDGAKARAAHAELAPEGFGFLHHPELAWPEQVRRYALDARGVELEPGWVRCSPRTVDAATPQPFAQAPLLDPDHLTLGPHREVACERDHQHEEAHHEP
ncbi:hypothetical protein BH24ACT8_BH24ACT8_09790 [soil metagenome]